MKKPFVEPTSSICADVYSHTRISVFILISIFVLGISWGNAQTLPQQQAIKDVIYTKSNYFGGSIMSDGYTLFTYRYLDIPSTYVDQGFEAEIGFIRHPKEVLSESPVPKYAASTTTFVFGKINTMINLRVGYGQVREITDKTDYGSVRLSYVYFGGFSLGILKPVFIEVDETPTERTISLVTTRFDPDEHSIGNIFGGASFFKGFDQLSFRPGIYGKFGVNVDFASSVQTAHMIELGVRGDYYFSEVPIFDQITENITLFFGFYLSYYYGIKWN